MTYPGKMNKRITFQQLASGDDEGGGKVEAWQDVVTVWASLDPLEGREFYQAQQTNSEITHKSRIFYRKDINSKMRFIYKGRIFNVSAVINENEANQYLIIRSKEQG